MEESKAQKDKNLPEERYDLKIVRSLRQIIHAVDIYSRKLVSKYQLTAPQLICLLTVTAKEKRPVKASEIARSVYLSPSTVVGILDRLEKKELITRSRDKIDRRVVNVTATDKGMKLAQNAPSPLQDNLAEAFNNLDESEQTTIARSLEKIVQLINAEGFEAPPILESGKIENEEKQI